MALGQRLDLRQSQSLVMTPQLQQAIKLLQLSNLELTDYVEQELERNPLLERDSSDPEGPVEADGSAGEIAIQASATASIDEKAASFDGDDAPLWQVEAGGEGQGSADSVGDPAAWSGVRDGRMDGGDLPGIEETIGRTISLREHLVGQLNCDIPDPADRMIGLFLIDHLDGGGYLTISVEDAADRLGADVGRVEQVLVHLQRFEPTGIFARGLAECLALQLCERGRLDPMMRSLLDHLPLLASRDGAQLLRVCKCTSEDLADMIAELKTLDPKPGHGFDPAPAQLVVPDILMRARQDGGWLIELNAETLPRVLVNTRYYAEVSKRLPNKEARDYLVEHYQSANWLVKSLHQRATTILKVASEIVRQQEGFFDQGIAHLRPLILRDIAEAIGMHESTVSRVTANKYMMTPRGLFELKYFFTSAIQAADGGATHSAESVKHRIRNLIDSELTDGVLSDDRLVELLRDNGIDIARRTVAKYREALGIPSSVLRRREKSLGMS